MSGSRTARLSWAALRDLTGRRHRLGIEAAVVLIVYCLYESSGWLLSGGRQAAIHHAKYIFDIERTAHINVETRLQMGSTAIPVLLKAFDVGYVTLHLGVTVAALIWLYRQEASRGYVRLRTALVAASSVALLGFTLLPTAPPRLAGIGVTDTVSQGAVNLNSFSLHWFYNPYAALPSVHMAYATLVGLGLFTYGTRYGTKILGVCYPMWVAVEVIATGNHFLTDVITGSLLAAGIWWATNYVLAARIGRPRSIAGSEASWPPGVAGEESAAA